VISPSTLKQPKTKKENKIPMSLPNKEALARLRALAASNKPKPLLLEEGEYRVRVASVAEKVSKTSGDPMLQLSLRLLDVVKKPLLFCYAMLAGKGSFTGDNFLAAVAYDPDQDGEDVECLVGRELIVEVSDEQAQDGTLKSRVKRFMLPEGDARSVSTTPEQLAVRVAARTTAETVSRISATPEGSPRIVSAYPKHSLAVEAEAQRLADGDDLNMTNGDAPAGTETEASAQEVAVKSESVTTIKNLADRSEGSPEINL
jgi:hypothetical protein